MRDVGSWLADLGLAEYAATLKDHKIDFETLSLLSETDFEKIGIPLGHRKKLLAAIGALDGVRPRMSHSTRQGPLGAPDKVSLGGFSESPLSSQPLGQAQDTDEQILLRSGRPSPAPPDRRQITVMFCDLIGSTKLSQELDPEDLREVLSAYQSCCASIIERFNGTISRFVGDGLLVLFGYPVAHEDAAERAVRASLGIIDAISRLDMSGLNTEAPLELRIGIATGIVVAGDLIGEGAAEQESIVGETPNLAARLQSIAEPNTVVASEATWQLVEGLFEYQDLGFHKLKGFADPKQAVRLIRERQIESRFEATREARGLTPAVGRHSELARLRERWGEARAGHGQVVCIRGEPGIGKSRLVQLLRDAITEDPHTRLSYYCSAHHKNTALFPLVNEIERSGNLRPDDSRSSKIEKLRSLLARTDQNRDDVVSLLARLLSIEEEVQDPTPDLTPEGRKSRTLGVLEDRFTQLARRQPVLLIFEDIHWVDPTTLELFGRLLDIIKPFRILVVATYRPEFEPPWNASERGLEIQLGRMDRRDSRALVRALTDGKGLPRQVLERILNQTDGIPLFIEELTKSVLEAGVLTLENGAYKLGGPLPAFAVPKSLQDSLMARLDRLKLAKMVAQVGAVIGRQFSYELLSKVTFLTAAEISLAIEELIGAELINWRSADHQGTYSFKHALVQDAAYSSLLRSGRQDLHARIAKALESRLSESTIVRPEIVAHHHSEAGNTESALKFWLLAGRCAAERSAHVEASDHLKRGLALLNGLEQTDTRDRMELEFQTTLGPSLIATQGYVAPEVEHANARARTLSEQAGDAEQMVRALRGSWAYFIVSGRLESARDAAEKLMAMAESEQSHDYALEAHRTLGQAQFYLGNFKDSLSHLERALDLYEPGRDQDHAVRYGNEPKAVALSYIGWASWYLGYPRRALEASLKAVDHARSIGHPFTIAQVMMDSVYVHSLRRDFTTTRNQAERTLAYAREQGFPYWAVIAEIFSAWAQAQERERTGPIQEIKRGLAKLESNGAIVAYPWFCTLLAEVQSANGEANEALETLAHAQPIAESLEDKVSLPEIHRVRGEVLLSIEDSDHAASCFRRALETARAQDARSWELRSGISLARLWRAMDRQSDACALLDPIIRAYPERGSAPDLDTAIRLRDWPV